jgi:hypothetical protein
MIQMDGKPNRRSGARGRRAMPVAAVLLLALAACRGDGIIEGGAHEPVARIDVVDARNETMEQRHLDSSVVGPMLAPQVPGRIIYDEPVSLAEVAAADTLVRRENTGTTAPESPERIARDSAAARASSAEARRGASGQGSTARDTTRTSPPRPERR